MNKSKIKKLNYKSCRGTAIATVVMIFFIISIFSSIVLMLFSSNLQSTTHQERSVEAYYLAYSGAELAYSALLADNNDLMNQIKNGTLSDTTSTLTVDNGTIDVTAARVNSASPFYSLYPGWIIITSTGTLSTGISRTRILLVDKDDSKNIVWK